MLAANTLRMAKKTDRRVIRMEEELWDAIRAVEDQVPAEQRPGQKGKGSAAVRWLCRIALKQVPAVPENHTQMLNAGRWYLDLPEAIQVKVQEIGDALVLLYKNRRSESGEVSLSGGTVRNTFVRTGTRGKSVTPRRSRKPR